jgi:hypothetical protein
MDTPYCLGANHRPAPPAIRPLATRARLSLLTPPRTCDWTTTCPADGNALGNDRLSNCVAIAELQAATIRRAAAWQDTRRPTEADAIALYSRDAGYDAVTGTGDDGTDTAAAMAAWCSEGVPISEQDNDIVAWASIDPADWDHLRLGIAHTGPAQATLALPDAARDTETWNRAPGSGTGGEPGGWGNHRVVLVGYDGATLICWTWGKRVLIHPEWWSRYRLAVDASLSWMWLDRLGTDPMRLDRPALADDMARLMAG